MNARLNKVPAREIITVPPHGKPQITCPLWPDCGCQADCTAGVERATRIQWVAYGLILATALIGASLIWWSYQP